MSWLFWWSKRQDPLSWISDDGVPNDRNSTFAGAFGFGKTHRKQMKDDENVEHRQASTQDQSDTTNTTNNSAGRTYTSCPVCSQLAWDTGYDACTACGATSRDINSGKYGIGLLPSATTLFRCHCKICGLNFAHHNANGQICSSCKNNPYQTYAGSQAALGGLQSNLSATQQAYQQQLAQAMQNAYTNQMTYSNSLLGTQQAGLQISGNVVYGNITHGVVTLGGSVFGHGISASPHKPTKFKAEAIIAGEITAWRAWSLGDDRALGGQLGLYSVTSGHRWEPETPMSCDAKHTPALGFGVHVFKTEMDLLHGYHGLLANYAFGEVLIWGDIIEHETGYRAEHCAIKSLAYCKSREVQSQLRAKYKVGAPRDDTILNTQ